MSSLQSASHRWLLRQVREAHRVTSLGRDRALPPLAGRRVLELPGAAGPLEGRLYKPRGLPADAPLMLFFHGGGFVMSDLDTHEAMCVRLADAGRMQILAARYRLAPEHRFPAQLDDAVAVLRWAVESGAGQGRPLAVGGDSAGAYLAASAAQIVERERPGSLAAQLLIYPLVHIDEEVWSTNLARHTRVLGWAAVRYIRRQLLEPGVVAPSLLAQPLSSLLPTVIVAGGPLDAVRDDAVALAERLGDAGAPVAWREYPLLPHGFGNITHASRTARRALAEVGTLAGQAARGGL